MFDRHRVYRCVDADRWAKTFEPVEVVFACPRRGERFRPLAKQRDQLSIGWAIARDLDTTNDSREFPPSLR